MGRTTYIQTDANTSNLVELLLQEIKSLRKEITDLKTSVTQLKPLNSVQLFSEEEAAAILNVSKNTLITLRYEHKIHFHKINARILYSVEDIREFEGRCRQQNHEQISEWKDFKRGRIRTNLSLYEVHESVFIGIKERLEWKCSKVLTQIT